MYNDFTKFPAGFRDELIIALKKLEEFLPIFERVAAMPEGERTSEEKEILSRLADIIPELQLVSNIMGNNAVHQATKYYHYIEYLAKTGKHPEAIKIYEDLRPVYLAAVKEDLDGATN